METIEGWKILVAYLIIWGSGFAGMLVHGVLRIEQPQIFWLIGAISGVIGLTFLLWSVPKP